jgi:hypothetical protein
MPPLIQTRKPIYQVRVKADQSLAGKPISPPGFTIFAFVVPLT